VDLSTALRAATARLAEAGVASPRADAEALAAHVLGTTRGDLSARALRGADLDVERADRFTALVDERVRRVPLQHLTGTTGFRGLDLAVGPGVFVPRPETELVAGAAVEAATAVGPAPVVVDLCTGSGAIAAAVAAEVPGAHVEAVEVDPQAHAWARRNLEGTGVVLHLADATDPAAPPHDLDGAVDVVVANPPYVPDDMRPLDPEVADHDPHLALYGGSDGLRVPLRVAARARVLLRPGGAFVMEHAHGQRVALVRALVAAGWDDVQGRDDLAGRERFVVARAGGARLADDLHERDGRHDVREGER
jgi:release factor glutamine methyltransferase